jgi:hypothetical protein
VTEELPHFKHQVIRKEIEVSLDIDIDQIWNAVNDNIPWVFAVLAIPAGIGIAIKLGQFVIGAIQKAF